MLTSGSLEVGTTQHLEIIGLFLQDNFYQIVGDREFIQFYSSWPTSQQDQNTQVRQLQLLAQNQQLLQKQLQQLQNIQSRQNELLLVSVDFFLLIF